MRQAEADPRAAVAISALPAELRRHLLSSRFARTRLQHLLERLQRLGLLQIEAEPPSRLAFGLGLGFGLGFGFAVWAVVRIKVRGWVCNPNPNPNPNPNQRCPWLQRCG